jgi:hypothetical protein
MEKIYQAVSRARGSGLPETNYWLYFKKDGTEIRAFEIENKTPGWIGYFVEDDSKLSAIYAVEQKKKWRKN